MLEKYKRHIIIGIITFFILSWLFPISEPEKPNVSIVPLSTWEQSLSKNEFSSIILTDKWVIGINKFNEKRAYGSNIIPNDSLLIEKIKESNIPYEYKSQEKNWFYELIVSLIPIFLLIGFLWWSTKKSLGPLSIGKTNAKLDVEAKTGVTFADVAGITEAKAELEEIVHYIKNPEKYSRLGGTLPKGILLVGPPGTGKTMLAKALAGEAKVPFIRVSGSEFVEMFVGVGASRVRDLFAKAKENAPCIIFIDELDALASSRKGAINSNHDEKGQTLNQLLVEMDGFEPNLGIMVLGATNRPEVLDPAIVRPGRFDRQVVVDLPDKLGREEIIRVHLPKILHTLTDEDIKQLSQLTPGFSGADLANMINEAALLASRRLDNEVNMSHMNEAIERTIAGLERKSRVLSEKEKEIVSYHECGHALVALALPNTDPVHKITIVPRGISALGYTLQRPDEEKFLKTKEDLFSEIMVLMGGRAAEELRFGKFTTGAVNDLQRASQIARDMITRFGMGSLGQIAWNLSTPTFLEMSKQTIDCSAEIQNKLDNEIIDVLNKAYSNAKLILSNNYVALDSLSKKLIEIETINQEDLPNIPKWYE